MTFATDEDTAGFDLLERIAAALRDELGIAIEEQPGLRDPSQASQVNRAFLITSRCILKAIAASDVDRPVYLHGTLFRLVRRRLVTGGLAEDQVEFLLGLEAGHIDWLAYFLLAPWQEIERVIREEYPGNPLAK
ncbi:hypothetical protein [Singulisphaera acidiphila]|uniref:Uncharacterized protein n=1 Tax=Singulisphaera acidiphila (strain ATCC BAA-1392 / DSM 18658 / VKM B-2454 / MOB10) TaxID=886293 RepID=L0DBU2_SINAD|nr:hypothetical protein [Singulisphaera acidiphila]AGA26325.1 hypothetical protein Sinac_1967 [Singulisphaera acidiphila DSM 18658]